MCHAMPKPFRNEVHNLSTLKKWLSCKQSDYQEILSALESLFESVESKPLSELVHVNIIKDMKEMERDVHVLLRKVALVIEKVKVQECSNEDIKRLILKAEDIFITALSEQDRWNDVMSRLDSICKD